MKGIILAAGRGTRLYPMTRALCKPLLPIYDKPMIYYPLAVLQQAQIRDVLMIVPKEDVDIFPRLFGDGSQFGMHITYQVQYVQRGIADAFLVGEEFIGDDSVCLILGDNMLYGENLQDCLLKAQENTAGATIFGYAVDDPSAFGVVEFDENGIAVGLEEKPEHPKSDYAVPGVYFYDNSVVEIAKQIQPSLRGELEITDVNRVYLKQGRLHVVTMDQSLVWLDAGTEDSLLDASNTVLSLQKKAGHLIGCIEREAYRNGWITKEEYLALGKAMRKTHYGKAIIREAEAE